MLKISACFVSGLMMVPLAGMATAQSAADFRVEERLGALLQQASRPPAPGTPAAVDVNGVFRFTITAHFGAVPDFNGGLFCHASVSQFTAMGSHSSSRDIPATLASGGRYRCVVKIPYHWVGADDAATISPNVTVYSTQVTHSLSDQNDVATQGLPPQPLPADGATTDFVVDFNM